jgi:hypothetical protein
MVSSVCCLENLRPPLRSPTAATAGGPVRGLQGGFDRDLEQGGNTNIVVRRDPATGDPTRVLVHRWCRPGRSPRSTSYALTDA